ncbi:TerB family tellurite resistance protein [Lutimonas sp.]|jgi:DnaJ like chaperone protein|uniref:TerB family tellurite resistance protein n=1 Tax=Lutimonas sp. TaxID=1872403 RepID=UPI003C72768D
MANFSKWLGAGLGWTFAGPIGGILGFVFGSFVDEFSESELLDMNRKTSKKQSTQSGDFEISLLVLAAIVIKSDGDVDKRELDFVRSSFISMYGQERANHAFKLFKGIIANNKISTRQVCLQINKHMNHASRLQLLHFLFGVAKSDGMVTENELHKINTIAGYLNINQYDFNSIKAMFYNEVDSSYKILEIDKSASDAEVKTAYRKMVKKYHPDKLRNLGPEHIKGAEDKFRQVQHAYEHIQKERGI